MNSENEYIKSVHTYGLSLSDMDLLQLYKIKCSIAQKQINEYIIIIFYSGKAILNKESLKQIYMAYGYHTLVQSIYSQLL